MLFLLVIIIGLIGSTLILSSRDALASDNNSERIIYQKRDYIVSDSENNYKLQPPVEIGEIEMNIEKSLERASLNSKINNLHSYLIKQNPSVFTREITTIIVTESDRMGADYRVVSAIMGKESGFCRANYKTYNCFGYLNGVQYGSYEEAFKNLVPKVAAKVAPHNWNTRGVAAEYRPVDQEGWAKRVYAIAIRIY